jgi:sugar-specific transcriptional regulator TrmB
MLESLGLDATTTSAYRIWLRNATLTIAEVAQQLEVEPEAVEAAQRVLLERGLLLVSWEESGRLVPVNPGITIERLYQEEQLRLARQQQELLAARAGRTDLVEDYARGVGSRSAADSVDQLEGIDRIRSTIEELSTTAQREVLAMHPSREHSATALREALALDVKAIERGLSLRSIYSDASQLDPATVEYHTEVTAAGMQVRVTPRRPGIALRKLVGPRLKVGLVRAPESTQTAGPTITFRR